MKLNSDKARLDSGSEPQGVAATLNALDIQARSPFESMAPWGEPPTPVLPECVIQDSALLPLPERLEDIGEARNGRIGDLLGLWQTRSAPLSKYERIELTKFFAKHLPEPEVEIVPVGIDLGFLLKTPLTMRVRNSLRSGGFVRGSNGLRVGDLIGEAYFGVGSLLQLMCIAESAVRSSRLPEAEFAPELRPHRVADSTAASTKNPANERSLVDLENCRAKLFRMLSIVCDLEGVRNLSDVLRPRILSVVGASGVDKELADISLLDLVEEQEIPSRAFYTHLESLVEEFSESEHKVATGRMCIDEQLTLSKLSKDIGVSEERVRHLQQRLERRATELGGAALDAIAGILEWQIGSITKKRLLHQRLMEVFPVKDTLAARMGRGILFSRLDRNPVLGFYLDSQAFKLVEAIRSRAQELADDVGLIDAEELRKLLPNRSWRNHWSQLLACAHITEIEGVPGLRDTQDARIKASMILIGGPSTVREIAAKCHLTIANVKKGLRRIRSVRQVGNDRWEVFQETAAS